MGIRKVVALVVVAGALATAQSASAGLLLGPPYLGVPPVLGSGLAYSNPNLLSTTCPKVSGTANLYRCVVTVAPGTTITCENGWYYNYNAYGEPYSTGCGITTPLLSVWCGSNDLNNQTYEGCSGVIGTTPLSLAPCTKVIGGPHQDTSITCTAGPVTYWESTGGWMYPAGPRQTLTIGNIKYGCINDVCTLTTS